MSSISYSAIGPEPVDLRLVDPVKAPGFFQSVDQHIDDVKPGLDGKYLLRLEAPGQPEKRVALGWLDGRAGIVALAAADVVHLDTQENVPRPCG